MSAFGHGWEGEAKISVMSSRLKRYQDAGHFHFLTFICYRHALLLCDDSMRTIFEKSLEILRRRHEFLVFGYVLMLDAPSMTCI